MLRNKKYFPTLRNLLKALDPYMLYTRTRMASSNASQPPNQPDIQSPAILHQSTETLIYNDFLRILLGRETTSLLIISGEPAPEELILAWENIQEQYSDCIKTTKAKTLLDINKKLLRSHWQITIIDDCIFILRKGWNKEPAEILNQLGYSMVENLADPDLYAAQINGIEMEAKFLIVLQNQLYNEYKRISGGETDAAITRTMDDYDKELAIISKYIGFDVDKMKITTAKFCAFLNIYLDHIESLEKAAANGRSV